MQWLAVIFFLLQSLLTDLLLRYFMDALFIAKGFVLHFCYTISLITVSLTDTFHYTGTIQFGAFHVVSYSILDVVLYLFSNSKLMEHFAFVSVT